MNDNDKLELLEDHPERDIIKDILNSGTKENTTFKINYRRAACLQSVLHIRTAETEQLNFDPDNLNSHSEEFLNLYNNLQKRFYVEYSKNDANYLFVKN